VTELVVVRHGQTDANAKGLLLGRLDVDLDDVGRAQAAALAEVLPTPDLVISSPLARTRQTAEAFGVDVEVSEDWIELDYGDWDGRPAGDVPAEAWRAWRADPDFAPPGGESLARLTARVHDALDDLVERLDGRRAVVVTHVSPVKAAVAWALDQGPELAWRTYVAPASITRIGVGRDADGPTLRTFNETAHLPPP
jgi:broad specificity phosphatase PhoE